jgi:hypothetical protein
MRHQQTKICIVKAVEYIERQPRIRNQKAFNHKTNDYSNRQSYLERRKFPQCSPRIPHGEAETNN